jgi:hypothetical protein
MSGYNSCMFAYGQVSVSMQACTVRMVLFGG